MENITGITKISYAKGLGGLSSSIRYVTQGAPHNSDHGEIKHRALAIHGFNVPDNPNLAYNVMKSTLNKNYITHINITCVRDIESFKGLNYHNKKDRYIALNLDKEFIKKAFPHNQVLIVLQADGKNHYLHCHNIICDRRMDNGHSIAHYSNFKNLAKLFDKTLIDNGYTPLHNGKLYHSKINRNHGIYYNFHHNKSFILKLSSKIYKAVNRSKNSDEFYNYLKHSGINVERFKMSKINGRRLPKLYNHITKNGKYKKLKNGKYLRFRKHWSYSLIFNNKKIVIRERKLGSIYSAHSLLNKLHNNKENIKNKSLISTIHNQSHIINTHNNNITNHKKLYSKLKYWNYKENQNIKEQEKIMNDADKANSQSENKSNTEDIESEFIKLMIYGAKHLHNRYNGPSW